MPCPDLANMGKNNELSNLLRTHDLTNSEIRESPVFQHLNDPQIDKVRTIFIQMCQILAESIDLQENMLGFETNEHHLAIKQPIELKPFKAKAA